MSQSFDSSAPPRTFAFPASMEQRRLWLAEQFEPSSAYHQPCVVRLRGRLDPSALQRALSAVVARHESLRTAFIERSGQVLQVIHSELDVRIAVEDLSADSSPERSALDRAESAARVPFNLAAAPLLRARLLRLGRDEHWLVLVLHHVVLDASSFPILVRELSAGYSAFSSDRSPCLPELPIQYADYAMWQQETECGPEEATARTEHWRSVLAGAPPILELPADRPRPSRRSMAGATHWVALPAEVVVPLRKHAIRFNASLYHVLLGGFFALLHRMTGREDLLVGTPATSRTRPELEGLIVTSLTCSSCERTSEAT